MRGAGMETSKVRLNGVEAARGIAATSVVLYHVGRHLAKVRGGPLSAGLFQFGHAGVDLFFVISGFIILYVHYPDIGRPDMLGRYARRRFTRVMPTYWVALVLTILLAYAGHRAVPSMDDLFWSVTLLPSHRQPLLGIAWTLRYEIFFYAMIAVLLWNRRAGLMLMAVWGAVIAAGLCGLGNFRVLPGPFHSAYDVEFLLGMAVAWTLHRRAVAAPRRVLLAGVVLFAIAASAEDLGVLNGYAAWARLAYGVPSALVVLGLAEAARRGALSVPGWLQRLGSASYSIYLFQFLFIGVAWKLLLATRVVTLLPKALVFLVLASCGVGGGIIMSRLVEQPLIRALRHRPALLPASAG